MENAPLTPDDLITRLNQAGIRTRLYHHEPVFTVAQSREADRGIEGAQCRNMFLKDKKGAMVLLTLRHETPIDLKKFSALINCGRLSFGSEDRLWTHLGVRPGSVTPFAILNDRDHRVRLVLERGMMDEERVNVHPLDNSMTLGLAPSDLVRFLERAGHAPLLVDLTPCAPD